MSPTKYRIIRLDNFETSLKKYFPHEKERIDQKVEDMLGSGPYRYPMLIGPITVRGVKLFGLRHMKVGVQGYRGGAVVLYRVCKECLDNRYYDKSGVRCDFCDGIQTDTVVVFDTYPRSQDYR